MTLTLWDRLRYVRHDLREARQEIRAFGLGHYLRSLKLIGSFVFGYRVKCFTCKHRIATWDPIVGAYCGPCFAVLIESGRVKS